MPSGQTAATATAVRRVLVIGHTGFIGSALLAELAATRPDIEVSGLSLSAIDMTDPASAVIVSRQLDPHTAVVMCAAIKRQLGDSPAIYLQNTQMIVNFANILAAHPVARVVYLSSAAVYGEDVENLAINEATPVNCRTYYGLSKMSAEWILTRTTSAHPGLTLGLVRPATVYGPGDLGTAYGPSGFLGATLAGKPITLWGDGTELREFIYITDVARMLARYVFVDHAGPINLASGTSYTFAGALDVIGNVTGRKPAVTMRPRSKDKVDNRFDTTLMRSVLPGLTFTSLEAGIKAMSDQAARAANSN